MKEPGGVALRGWGRRGRAALARGAVASLLCAGCLVSALAPRCGAGDSTPGSFAADSLLMPTECFVVTHEELVERNIHTLDDILNLCPGVAVWREGPPASPGGFSIDGRSARGVNLFVNGSPVVDAYSLESLSRFISLSRLVRVEVLYSGSPYCTGDLSSNGAINIVLEEGGREGPTSDVDFTYGTANIRARRAWFATPRAHISGSLAYDEYLQNPEDLYLPDQARPLGAYEGRTVLGEIAIRSAAGDDVLLHFQRYEDSYVGTSYRWNEDLRYSGFASDMSYRRGGFSGALRQRVLLSSRLVGYVREYTLGGAAGWRGSLGPASIRAFGSGERSEFDNRLGGRFFDPSYHRFEGGATLGAKLPSEVTWRIGAFGGDHSAVGRYGCAEVAIAKAWSARFSQDVIVARRLRIPSAQELFQPELSVRMNGDSVATAGSGRCTPEVADELSIGVRVPSCSFSFFGRNEKSRIVLEGTSPAVYRSAGDGRVAGVRGRFDGAKRILGFQCTLSVGAEGFPEREALAPGVPRYLIVAEAGVQHRVFKSSEILSVKWNTEAAGKRPWERTELGACYLHNLSVSLSMMSARLSFELRNILDARYETVPGFEMPHRQFLIGVFWELFD